MSKTTPNRRYRHRLATAALAGFALACIAITPAAARTAPPPHRGPCATHAMTRRHQSMFRFAALHGTTPLEVVARTFACYDGEPPAAFAADVNGGQWRRYLPAHVELFFAIPIASPSGSPR
jgi:hypothetical protein